MTLTTRQKNSLLRRLEDDGIEHRAALRLIARVESGRVPICPDCGELHEERGHMGCQYPQDISSPGFDLPSYGD